MSIGVGASVGAERRWNVPLVAGAALSLFAFVTVNYWIYTARWWFIAEHAEGYTRPPTISRSISVPEIGAPFAVWVSISAVCLFGAVAILAWHYIGIRRHMVRPRPIVRAVIWTMVPLALALQGVSGWGIHTQSVFTFANDPARHMFASTVFFGSQAAVILAYAVFNHGLLLDLDNLRRVEAAGAIRVRWVRLRRAVSGVAVLMAVIFGALFKLKDVYPYEEVPWVHITYVSAEPVVITVFLSVVLLAFADKLRA